MKIKPSTLVIFLLAAIAGYFTAAKIKNTYYWFTDTSTTVKGDNYYCIVVYTPEPVMSCIDK